jgi:hypothetical protein
MLEWPTSKHFHTLENIFTNPVAKCKRILRTKYHLMIFRIWQKTVWKIHMYWIKALDLKFHSFKSEHHIKEQSQRAQNLFGNDSFLLRFRCLSTITWSLCSGNIIIIMTRKIYLPLFHSEVIKILEIWCPSSNASRYDVSWRPTPETFMVSNLFSNESPCWRHHLRFCNII